MTLLTKFGLVLVAGSLVLNTVTLTVAMAAAEDFYLSSDGVPVASLTSIPPPDIALPNYDSWRDPEPGTLVKKGGSGSGETDPTKFQQWQIDVSGTTLSVSTLTIWVMGANDADVDFTAYLLRCSATCVSLASKFKSVKNPTTWKKTPVSLSTSQSTYAAGERLVVKIVVTSASDDDMLLAYGTQSYASALKLNVTTPPTTTTTLPASTTTSSPGPTTTTPGPTTTSVGLTTTTSAGGAGSTTAGTASTTTLSASTNSAQSGTEPAGGSTTTLASSPDATPIAVGDPGTEMIVEASAAGVTDDVFGVDRRLSPQQGLTVSFLSAAEAFRSQFLASTGLGLVGALLVVSGMRRKSDEE